MNCPILRQDRAALVTNRQPDSDRSVTLQSRFGGWCTWRNDIAIQRTWVAQAECPAPGRGVRRLSLLTPDRITIGRKTGVLYPSELSTGMRIYVEYNKRDPNLVRVRTVTPDWRSSRVNRGGGLLIAAAALVVLAVLDKRLERRENCCLQRAEQQSSHAMPQPLRWPADSVARVAIVADVPQVTSQQRCQGAPRTSASNRHEALGVPTRCQVKTAPSDFTTASVLRVPSRRSQQTTLPLACPPEC